MNMKKPRRIMHLDGDAFFVGVEMAKNPRLRGKAVVTGQERGIASAMSYEAKKLGITRGMPVFQIRKQFPQVIVTASDYESYAVFSRRMIDIVKRYADIVEEYSIDECFADLTDSPELSADPLALLSKIKSDIRRELGLSVSLGLGPTKVLAKTASKMKKPDGLVILSAEDIPKALDQTPVDKVWGIGAATSFALRRLGVRTALELSRKPLPWVEEHFSKPMAEMWHELNGISVNVVKPEYEKQKSIMKSRTFVPASADRTRVFSQLSNNMENACRKARDLGLCACELHIYLKTRDFSYKREGCRLAFPTNDPFEILREATELFERIFEEGVSYRATGVVLSGLFPVETKQESLFKKSDAKTRVIEAIDRINKKYGKSLIHIAASAQAFSREREGPKRLSVPFLGEAF